jgi:hypothetical protein
MTQSRQTLDALPEAFGTDPVRARITLMAASFERLLGRPLVVSGEELVTALWNAPFAILAHGTEPDPVFFFGNRYALEAFAVDVERFTQMPSRFSAEADLWNARQALLDRVAAQGYIDDYSGVRISATGRRFRIEGAIVWNIVDDCGVRHGQAASFRL